MSIIKGIKNSICIRILFCRVFFFFFKSIFLCVDIADSGRIYVKLLMDTLGNGKTTGDFYFLPDAFLYFYNKNLLLIIRKKIHFNYFKHTQFLYNKIFSTSQAFVDLVNII